MNKLDVDQLEIIEALFSDIAFGIVVTDPSGTVLLFNNAATDILGVGLSRVRPEDWPQQYGIYLPDGVTLCPVSEALLLSGHLEARL